MGEVYRARDTRLGRDVALKILPADVANDSVRRQRFEQEARAVAALNHPNIVAIYDVGDNYIVTELVDGEPLRGAKPSLRKTIEIGAQIASGLACAHDAGITHRDLKPDNILLTREGRVKILDFGLAKVPGAMTGGVTETLTEPGTVMGTVSFMSPEQVRGAAIDHRSDIFSLGLILYGLLAGKRAFKGDTSAETMTASSSRNRRNCLKVCLAAPPDRFALPRKRSGGAIPIGAGPAVRPGASGYAQREPGYGSASTPPGTAWVRQTLAALVLIAATAGAARWLWRDAAVPQWSGVLLGGPEMALDPRLSPDGNLLAFKTFDNALTQVAVMKPESGNWSILTHRRDRGRPNVSWSADGSLIYYDRATGVPLGVLQRAGPGRRGTPGAGRTPPPEALPDGSLLLSRLNGRREGQVYRFYPETGLLKEFPLERPQYFAPACGRVPPGGKAAIIYATPIGRGGQGPGLYAIDLASNDIHRLALPEQEAAALEAWTVARDGKSVLAALPAGSVTRVVAIPTG